MKVSEKKTELNSTKWLLKPFSKHGKYKNPWAFRILVFFKL